jgi:hypothetical protein
VSGGGGPNRSVQQTSRKRPRADSGSSLGPIRKHKRTANTSSPFIVDSSDSSDSSRSSRSSHSSDSSSGTDSDWDKEAEDDSSPGEWPFGRAYAFEDSDLGSGDEQAGTARAEEKSEERELHSDSDPHYLGTRSLASEVVAAHQGNVDDKAGNSFGLPQPQVPESIAKVERKFSWSQSGQDFEFDDSDNSSGGVDV